MTKQLRDGMAERTRQAHRRGRHWQGGGTNCALSSRGSTRPAREGWHTLVAFLGDSVGHCEREGWL